jgi:hypothetical protein
MVSRVSHAHTVRLRRLAAARFTAALSSSAPLPHEAQRSLLPLLRQSCRASQLCLPLVEAIVGAVPDVDVSDVCSAADPLRCCSHHLCFGLFSFALGRQTVRSVFFFFFVVGGGN